MKLLILALCIASTYAIGKRCTSADDCEEDECCVNFILTSAFGGLCRKLRDEGQICAPIVKDNDEVPDMYHFVCPCKEGLECKAKHDVRLGEHVIRLKPRCAVPEDIEEPITDEPVPEE
ncbi:toxin CSTX-20-like [Uloborus diversus]|uniref:toxin CSTX-20-like n=1 Tax=Uloborus diversus TaxID=327109 RepID=UPI00240935AB|nr:toxin CSTX-20-like [Uloborus diversus]